MSSKHSEENRALADEARTNGPKIETKGREQNGILEKRQPARRAL